MMRYLIVLCHIGVMVFISKQNLKIEWLDWILVYQCL
jgi:hypothetical protein